MRGTLEERLFARLVATDPPTSHDRLGREIVGQCLLWQGCRNGGGYGLINTGNKVNRTVHRVALALARNCGLEDLAELDHRCRVRHCAQPLHLEEVTHIDNVRRGDTGAWRRSITHCPKGHPYDASNTYHSPPRPGAPSGRRICRACSLAASRAYKRRRAAARASVGE